MKRLAIVAVTAAAALYGSLVVAPGAGAAPARATTTLRAGTALAAGTLLRSANGAYTATVTARGRLVVRHRSTEIWGTSTKGAHARLVLRRYGDLVLVSGARVLWSSHTAGSAATKLVMTDSGSLALRAARGTIWNQVVGNGCAGGSGKRVLIDLGQQRARLCDGADQQLVTPITSGASAYGNATPTGTWRLQAKQRERYLYPAAGGAYYVHYWMPYDGAYGMHDSSWQKFPYGSSRYRTDGSHGCVHFPRAAIAWMFAWAPIGTLVRISA